MNLHEQRNYIIMRYDSILFMYLHAKFEKILSWKKYSRGKKYFPQFHLSSINVRRDSLSHRSAN